MKTIQITIDEPLLDCLDGVIGHNGRSRSAYIRDAIRDALHRDRIAEMERQHAEGYALLPETPEEMAEMAAWEAIQTWDDEWIAEWADN